MLLVRRLVVRHVSVKAQQTDNYFDDMLVLLIQKVNLAVVFVIAFYAAQKALALPAKIVQVERTLAIAAAFAQVAFWGNAIITFFLTRTSEKAQTGEINVSAHRAIAFLARLAVWTLVGALLLENLGIHLSALLAGVGIGGIAIALAAQNILADMFCYVAIILDKPFIAGDFIVTGEMAGSVERIGIKTTRLRSVNGEQLVISNQDLVSSRVRNYKNMDERRVVHTIGVIYETPPEKLRRIPEIAKEVITGVEKTRFDRAHFAKFGHFSLDFEIVYYVLDRDYKLHMDIQQQVLLGRVSRFAEEGIEFAYPTNLTYHKDLKPTDS
jgi:small-conductance mechanosensitive channel